MATKTLEQMLAKISAVFNTQQIVEKDITLSDVQHYYLVKSLAYSLFHNNYGFTHMGISLDGVYKPRDLKGHVVFVEKEINKIKAKKVMEIVSGRAANLAYLATHNPKVQFYGIEISQGQLKHAQKKVKNEIRYNKCSNKYNRCNITITRVLFVFHLYMNIIFISNYKIPIKVIIVIVLSNFMVNLFLYS